jgi:hypothetical protein
VEAESETRAAERKKSEQVLSVALYSPPWLLFSLVHAPYILTMDRWSKVRRASTSFRSWAAWAGVKSLRLNTLAAYRASPGRQLDDDEDEVLRRWRAAGAGPPGEEGKEIGWGS